MRLRNIASALIAALCVNASAQTTSKNGNDPIGDRPKMVVNIVVDGLRADYIEQLWDDLSDGGFRKVIIKGQKNLQGQKLFRRFFFSYITN